eukprot:1158148-Pelagomonas_calceolata.AAC.2
MIKEDGCLHVCMFGCTSALSAGSQTIWLKALAAIACLGAQVLDTATHDVERSQGVHHPRYSRANLCCCVRTRAVLT